MAKGRDFARGVPPAPVESVKAFLEGTAGAAARWHDPSRAAMTRVACAPTTPNFNFAPEALPEIARLAETGTGMTHCPPANARLGSGIAPAPALHRAGGAVSLSVDGAPPTWARRSTAACTTPRLPQS